MQYSLVLTEEYSKGTDVRVYQTGTQEQLRQQQSEIHWAGKRGEPHIMPSEDVAAFTQQHQTGIYKPGYTPPSQAERKTEYEREKRQEAFERETETAKEPTREGAIARGLVKSKYGIEVRAKPTIQPTTREEFATSLFGRMIKGERERRIAETTAKIEARRPPPTPPLAILGKQRPLERAEYVAAPPPTPGFRGLSERLSQKAERIQFEAQFRTEKKKPLQRQFTMFKAAGYAAAAVPIFVLTHPVKAAKGFFRFVTKPGESLKGIMYGLKERPGTTVGTIAGALAVGKGIGLGIKGVRVAKVKVTPVKVAAKKGAIVKVMTAPKGEKAFKIDPMAFKATIAGKKLKGIAEGAGAVTKKKVFGAIYKYKVKPERGIRETTAVAAVKGRMFQIKDVSKGFAVTKAVIKTPTKTIKESAIMGITAKKIVSGPHPVVLARIGIIKKAIRGKMKVTEGGVIVAKRTLEVGERELWKVLEKTVPAKAIKKAFPPLRMGKRAELISPTTPKIKPPTPGIPAVAGGILYKGIRETVRGAEIARIQHFPTIPFPIGAGMIPRQRVGERLIQGPSLGITPRISEIASSKRVAAPYPSFKIDIPIKAAPMRVAIAPTISAAAVSRAAVSPAPLFSITPPTPSPPPPITTFPIISPPGAAAAFFRPRQEEEELKLKKKKIKAPKRAFRYTPSVAAITFDIKGIVPKKVKLTGLEIRPIPK